MIAVRSRWNEHASIVAGVLLGTLFLSLFSAGVVFGQQVRDRDLDIRIGGYGVVMPFGGAREEVQVQADVPVAEVAAMTVSDYSVEGVPTISAEKINAVLTEYGSPAQGLGQVFMDMGAKYGINPAYALAFYIHESHAGTRGVARFTKSIGNIRTTPGYKDYEGYRLYDTFEHSIEDWYKLIRELYIDGWGLRTVDKILPVYAPPADNNDTQAYIESVQYLVDSWR